MSLRGRKILVTAGPTRENWDTVRYITSRSSGKMGFAIARKAAEAGASVILISSVTPEGDVNGVEFAMVESAEDMFKSVKEHFKEIDIFISSAAVSDFRPVRSITKISKSSGIPSIRLERNPDILQWAGRNRGERLLVGFSLGDIIDTGAAREKMRRKNCQIMIANASENMGTDLRSFTVITGKEEEHYSGISVSTAASVILEECENLLTDCLNCS